MSINHNRIKVADLEKNQPNKILTTNTSGEVEFNDISTILVNDLITGGTTKALSAEMGKTLQTSKVDKVTGKSLLSNTEITRLETLSNYTHPANHAPSIITQDPNNRFVTDAEKTAWNAKQPAGTYAIGTGSATGVNTGDNAVNSLYSGLVSNATHTGDATGSTTLTVKGINGTSLSGLATGLLKNTTTTGIPVIASVRTDYAEPTTALATGILKNTTSTGAHTIAVASDFPILNQNTTGTAGTITGSITESQVTNLVTDLGAKVDKVTGKSLVSDTEITRLAALSNYTHPANHAPSIITQDPNNRFVTDAEKAAWNAKQPAGTYATGTGTATGTNTGDNAINVLYNGLVSNATHTGDATGSTALTVKGINGTLLSNLATGILKNTTTTGVPVIATVRTDYAEPTTALATGILKNTTTTGAHTIAVAGDFPILNQNTTGTASNVTGIIAIANGGTNSTATPTNGGVGYGTGAAHAYSAVGTSGQFLKSNAAATPTWTTLSLTDIPGSSYKEAVKAATIADLAAASSTSTTITGSLVVFPVQDGVTLVLNDRILVKDQTAPAQNGIYILTTVGVTSTTAWVLTRASDADIAGELAGGTVNVDSGTTNGGVLFTTSLKSTDTIGTTSVNWYKLLDVGDLVVATSTSVSALKYNGTTSLAGAFDGGSTSPSASNRLNYNGNFYPKDLNLSASADTATAATNYFVETGSDGFVRPKTLANVKTEIVTKAAIEASLTGAITSHTHSYLPLAGGTVTGALTIISTLNVTGLISGNGKQIFNTGDAWLRINENSAFTAGTYFGSSVVRTDSELQVGASGSTFRANSSVFTYLGNNILHASNYSSYSAFSGAITGASLTVTGDVTAFSDARVKENIRPIKNVIDRIQKSRGIVYDRIDTKQKDNIGFIAQELEENFPELVLTREDGTKAVKYQNAVAVLFEAIKEQQIQIDILIKKINN